MTANKSSGPTTYSVPLFVLATIVGVAGLTLGIAQMAMGPAPNDHSGLVLASTSITILAAAYGYRRGPRPRGFRTWVGLVSGIALGLIVAWVVAFR